MQLILSNLYTISHNPITNTIHEESIDYSKKLLLYQMTLMMTLIYLKKKKNGQDFTKFIVLTPKWSYQMSDGFNKAFEKKIIRKENYDKKIWAIPFRGIPFTKFSYLKLVRLDLPISSSQTNAFKSAL